MSKPTHPQDPAAPNPPFGAPVQPGYQAWSPHPQAFGPAPPGWDVPTGPTKRAWSPAAIFGIGFFCTFLASSILYELNFERLGQPRKHRNLRIAGWTIGFFIYLCGIYSLPDETWVTQASTLFAALIAGVQASRHKNAFNAYLQRGGVKASPWPAFGISLAGAMVLFGAIFGVEYVRYAEHEARFVEANALMDAGEYEKAEPMYIDYKKTYPDEPAVYNNLALLYAHQGKFKEAYEQAQETRRIDPKYAREQKLFESILDVEQDAAIQLLEKQDFEGAVVRLTSILDRLPADGAARHNLAFAQYKLANYDQARTEMDTLAAGPQPLTDNAADLRENIEVEHAKAAVAEWEAGDFPGAAQGLEAVYLRIPHNESVVYNLMVLYTDTDGSNAGTYKPDRAKELGRAFIKHDPTADSRKLGAALRQIDAQ